MGIAMLAPDVAPDVCLMPPTAGTRSMAFGEMLFLEGDSPSALYQVSEGFMKLTWASPAGRETITELLLPGDVFDLPSCLDGRPYPLACQAPSNHPATIWFVPRCQVLHDPQLGGRCQARINQQLRRQRVHPVATAGERVEVRLARAMLCFAHALGTQDGASVTFPLWLTRQEVAGWVGTSTESVSRVWSDLRRRGLIQCHKGAVTLPNTEDIRRLTAASG